MGKLYRFGIKNKYYEKTTNINIDKKNYEVALNYLDPIPITRNHIGFETTEDTVYVSLSDCVLLGQNEQETKEIREHFDLVLRDYFAGNFRNCRKRVNEKKENPKRLYDGLTDPVLSYLPQVKTESYNGKIFILINSYSASAAEKGTALAYFGGLYKYVLPNSKVQINLCYQDGQKRAGIAQNEYWHGDTYGFYPDYYATSENLMDSLVYLTGDSDLPKVLAGIEKELK